MKPCGYFSVLPPVVLKQLSWRLLPALPSATLWLPRLSGVYYTYSTISPAWLGYSGEGFAE